MSKRARSSIEIPDGPVARQTPSSGGVALNGSTGKAASKSERKAGNALAVNPLQARAKPAPARALTENERIKGQQLRRKVKGDCLAGVTCSKEAVTKAKDHCLEVAKKGHGVALCADIIEVSQKSHADAHKLGLLYVVDAMLSHITRLTQKQGAAAGKEEVAFLNVFVASVRDRLSSLLEAVTTVANAASVRKTLDAWASRSILSAAALSAGIARINPLVQDAKRLQEEKGRPGGYVYVPVGEQTVDVFRMYLMDQYGSFGGDWPSGIKQPELATSEAVLQSGLLDWRFKEQYSRKAVNWDSWDEDTPVQPFDAMDADDNRTVGTEWEAEEEEDKPPSKSARRSRSQHSHHHARVSNGSGASNGALALAPAPLAAAPKQHSVPDDLDVDALYDASVPMPSSGRRVPPPFGGGVPGVLAPAGAAAGRHTPPNSGSQLGNLYGGHFLGASGMALPSPLVPAGSSGGAHFGGGPGRAHPAQWPEGFPGPQSASHMYGSGGPPYMGGHHENPQFHDNGQDRPRPPFWLQEAEEEELYDEQGMRVERAAAEQPWPGQRKGHDRMGAHDLYRAQDPYAQTLDPYGQQLSHYGGAPYVPSWDEPGGGADEMGALYEPGLVDSNPASPSDSAPPPLPPGPPPGAFGAEEPYDKLDGHGSPPPMPDEPPPLPDADPPLPQEFEEGSPAGPPPLPDDGENGLHDDGRFAAHHVPPQHLPPQMADFGPPQGLPPPPIAHLRHLNMPLAPPMPLAPAPLPPPPFFPPPGAVPHFQLQQHHQQGW